MHLWSQLLSQKKESLWSPNVLSWATLALARKPTPTREIDFSGLVDRAAVLSTFLLDVWNPLEASVVKFSPCKWFSPKSAYDVYHLRNNLLMLEILHNRPLVA